MKQMGEMISESGYVDMRSKTYEQNVMADAFNKICVENYRMRELLTRTYGHLSCDCEVAKEVESFLAGHS